MTKKLILAALALVACSHIARADSYLLSLEESIELAKEKSYSMERMKQNLQMAEYDLKATTARLKTHITLDLTAPSYSEDVSSSTDETGYVSYFSQKLLRVDGGLRINQPLPTDGNVYIQTGFWDNDYRNTSMRSMSFNTRVGLDQPLDALYGFNSIKAALQRARLAYEQTSKTLKREELNLIYNVSSAFYNLLSLQKSMEIAKMDLDRQTDVYDMSKKKYDAGLIREVDALQMEVDLADAQNNYDIAILNMESANNSFKELLGIGLGDEVSLKSDLHYDPVVVDPDKAVELALKYRLEIREREIQIELQKLSLKEQKAVGLPSARLSAYFERIGIANDQMSVGLPGTVDNVFNSFGRRPSNFGIGLTISIPILDWGENRNRVRRAQTLLEQNRILKIETERQIETGVRNLVADINSALKRLQLLEKNVEVAEKSFEITLKRFSDGDIDSEALALERSRLNRTYTSHLNAYITYRLSLANLMRQTFYDYFNDRPIE